MARRRLLLAALLCCALATACASGSAHGIAPHPGQPLRVAVVPATATVPVRHLADTVTPPEPPPTGEAEQAAIDARMAEVTTVLTWSLVDRLGDHFEIVPQEAVARAVAEIPRPADSERREWLAAVGRAAGAQAVLHVELSGYGRIKRRWLAYLIGSGVAEGVVQGAIAATVTNAWVGLAVAAEEIASEVLTWGGGAFLFNAYYAPITLETELIASRDGHRLWHKVTFVAIDRKALKKLPKQERKRREVQLHATLTKAERKLVASLRKAAKHHE